MLSTFLGTLKLLITVLWVNPELGLNFQFNNFNIHYMTRELLVMPPCSPTYSSTFPAPPHRGHATCCERLLCVGFLIHLKRSLTSDSGTGCKGAEQE